MLDEQELVSKVLEGDREAVYQFIRRIDRGIHLQIWSLGVRGYVDTEEAKQDAYYEIFKRLPRFDSSRAGLSTFIGMAAKAAIVDRYRKVYGRKGQRVNLVNALPLDRQVDPGTGDKPTTIAESVPDPSLDTPESSVHVREISASVEALHEPHRSVIIALADGKTMKDVGEDLDISESRVSQIATEARGILGGKKSIKARRLSEEEKIEAVKKVYPSLQTREIEITEMSMEGRTIGDIAKELKIQPSSVAQALSKIRRVLRQELPTGVGIPKTLLPGQKGGRRIRQSTRSSASNNEIVHLNMSSGEAQACYIALDEKVQVLQEQINTYQSDLNNYERLRQKLQLLIKT